MHSCSLNFPDHEFLLEILSGYTIHEAAKNIGVNKEDLNSRLKEFRFRCEILDTSMLPLAYKARIAMGRFDVKLIVAGGRKYKLTPQDCGLITKVKPKEIVVGGARGVDYDAKEYAVNNKIPYKLFKANWKAYKRAAGPIRNREMAAYADAVMLFPGEKGTDSMYKEAKKAGLIIYDYRRRSSKPPEAFSMLRKEMAFGRRKYPNNIY